MYTTRSLRVYFHRNFKTFKTWFLPLKDMAYPLSTIFLLSPYFSLFMVELCRLCATFVSLRLAVLSSRRARMQTFKGVPGMCFILGADQKERGLWGREWKDQKTYRARKPSRKAPETTFGCFSKQPKNFEPEKYVIFSRKFHGYSLPPVKRFRVCFSCTCLIKWRPPTYFLGQNKRQWS